MELSDKTIADLEGLLIDVNAGETSAFNQIVFRIGDRFRQLTHRMLRDFPGVRRWEDTDDIFQASLIRLHRSLTETHPDTVRGFLGLGATQVKRTLIDLARHYYGVYGRGRLHHTDPDGRPADAPGGPLEKYEQPESLEQWTEFHEATRNLPDEERETFDLCWYAGLQQEEAAKIMGVSRRTVIRRLQKAKLILKSMLSE